MEFLTSFESKYTQSNRVIEIEECYIIEGKMNIVKRILNYGTSNRQGANGGGVSVEYGNIEAAKAVSGRTE